MNHSTPPFDLVIGLDRSDQKADLHFIEVRSGTRRAQTIGTAPEALHDWLGQLRQEHPGARVALCVEQPAASLILFLETYAWINSLCDQSDHAAEVPRGLRDQPGQG